MAQSEYLCLERRLRAKPPEEHPPDQAEQVPHRAFIARFGPSRQADGICGSYRRRSRTEFCRTGRSDKASPSVPKAGRLQRRDRIAALVRELAAKRFTYCEKAA